MKACLALHILQNMMIKIILQKILLKNQNSKQKSKQILNSIKQYAIMKIFSAFQAAPSVQLIYGFDLIINENSIIFSMQKGVQISKYFKSFQTNNLKQNIQKSFDDLRKSLLLLHSFNITHNDIKPENIVFSPSKNKLVFIDFGLSQANPQKIGQMKLQKSKGSFYYCCQDMKKLFKSTSGRGYVDMYYNDFYGLQNSRKNIQHVYSDFEYRNQNNNAYLINCLSDKDQQILSNDEQKEQIISINLMHAIYFQKLNEIQHLIVHKQQVLVNILNKYLYIIYIVFFEAIYNLSLFVVYQKLKNLLIKNKNNISISLSSRQIFQNYLDPYFVNFIQQFSQFNNIHQKICKKHVKVRQEYINKQQTYKQQFFTKQTIQKQFSINIDPLKIKINTLKSIKQSAERLIIFFNQHSFLFQYFLELFKKINQKISQFEYIWLDIDQKIVQKYVQMFKNIYIQIQFQEIRFSKQFYSISTSGLKIVAIFQLLEEISLLFIQNFDIFKCIKQALIQINNKKLKNSDKINLMSNQNICQIYKKIQNNQYNSNNVIENQQETYEVIQKYKNIRYNFFQYCIYFLSNLNKFIQKHVEYQVAINKTQQILQILIKTIVKITYFQSIIFEQNKNYKQIYKQEHKKLEKNISHLLDNWYKIIFHCFFLSEERYDIFKLLDFYQKLYFFEEYLNKIVIQILLNIKFSFKKVIINQILKYYQQVFIKNKNSEWKIKQFHSLSIDLMIFLEKYQAETLAKKLEDFLQMTKFFKINNSEIEYIKISIIWKLNYFFQTPRMKYNIESLIKKLILFKLLFYKIILVYRIYYFSYKITQQLKMFYNIKKSAYYTKNIEESIEKNRNVFQLIGFSNVVNKKYAKHIIKCSKQFQIILSFKKYERSFCL